MQHGIGFVETFDRKFTSLGRSLKQLGEAGGIGREQLEPIGDKASGGRTLIVDPSREQNLLDCIQLGMAPRLAPFSQIFPQQPEVHERLVTLVCQIRTDDAVKVSPVFMEEEEIQLVTGVLRVESRLFLGRQLGPIDQRGEFIQGGIIRQGAIQGVDPTQAVVNFVTSRRDIGHFECLGWPNHRYEPLLGEVLCRIEASQKPKIAGDQFMLRQAECTDRGVERIDGDHDQVLMSPQGFKGNSQPALLIGNQIRHQHR